MSIKDFVIPIILFLIGLAFRIVGSLFKILHWEIGFLNGGLLLIVATGFQIIAIVIAILKLISFYTSKK